MKPYMRWTDVAHRIMAAIVLGKVSIMAGTLLIVGATGDVGQGIARGAFAQGWTVVAAGRSAEKLDRLFGTATGQGVLTCAGDVASEEGALALWHAATAIAGPIDAVIISVNAPNRTAPLAQWSGADVSALFDANLLTHFHAAKVMLPLLPAEGMLIGIGGGTADFVIPGMAPVSMAQAALRMFYRGLARERKETAEVRELMIVSMVNGTSKRDRAQPEWVTDEEVGRHVCAILAAPHQFPGPILQLKSREQIGQPDQPSVKDKP
jgi:NAD(P)-dependent dehydrogenase (short-subunit alcohol dehydrogenase family)